VFEWQKISWRLNLLIVKVRPKCSVLGELGWGWGGSITGFTQNVHCRMPSGVSAERVYLGWL